MVDKRNQRVSDPEGERLLSRGQNEAVLAAKGFDQLPNFDALSRQATLRSIAAARQGAAGAKVNFR